MKFLYVYVLTIIMAEDTRPKTAKLLEDLARRKLKESCDNLLGDHEDLLPIELKEKDWKGISNYWKKTWKQENNITDVNNKELIQWLDSENCPGSHRYGKVPLIIDYLNFLEENAKGKKESAEKDYYTAQQAKFFNLINDEKQTYQLKDLDRDKFKEWYNDEKKKPKKKYESNNANSPIVTWLNEDNATSEVEPAEILFDYLQDVMDKAKKVYNGAVKDHEAMSNLGIGGYTYHAPKNEDDVCNKNLFHKREFIGNQTRGVNEVRVMHWNILADGLAGSGLALKEYSKSLEKQFASPKESLIWDYRKWLILEEIAHYEPDIITLVELDGNQDIEMKDLWKKTKKEDIVNETESLQWYLENIGYDMVYKAKKATFSEMGTGIFWKKDMFDVVQFEPVYADDEDKTKKKSKVLLWKPFAGGTGGQIFSLIRFKLLKGKNRKLAVCTVHLQSDKDQNGEINRALQISEALDLLDYDSNTETLQKMLSEMKLEDKNNKKITLKREEKKAFVNEPIMSNYAVIITGDFNAERKMLVSTEGETVWPLAVSIPLRAGFKSFYEEVAGVDLPWTSWKKRPAGRTDQYTIDYVLGSEKTKGLAVLGIPKGKIDPEILLPNYQSGSDHISLVVDFEVLEKPLPSSGNTVARQSENHVAPQSENHVPPQSENPAVSSTYLWMVLGFTIFVVVFTMLYSRFSGPEKQPSKTQSQSSSVD